MASKDHEVIIIGGSENLNNLHSSDPFTALVNQWVEDQSRAIRDRVGDTFPQFNRQLECERIRDYGLRANLLNVLAEAIANGDMFIARNKSDPRIVGMIKAYKLDPEQVGGTLAGSEVVEIGKAFVIPEVRGNGVYSQLRTQVIDHVKAKYPNATLLTGTKSPAVQHMSRKAGWREVPYGDYMRIHCASPTEIAMNESQLIADGWTCFLCEPKSKPLETENSDLENE